MENRSSVARRAGLLYLVFALLAIFAYMYVPSRFVDYGDAAATARRIAEQETLYRMGILASFAVHTLFIFLVLTLYQLFRDVDRGPARVMVALVLVGVAGEMVSLGYRTMPLSLQEGTGYWSSFSSAQRDDVGLGFLRLGSNLSQLLSIFWGLWLFPFGILTIRSRFLPKILGYLLLVAGTAYVVSGSVRLVSPELWSQVGRYVMPFYFGEIPIIFWLLIRGAKKEPQQEPRLSPA